VSKGTIKQHEKRPPVIEFSNGRPSVLNKNELDELEKFIIESFYERKPATYLDLLDYIDYHFQKSILANTLRHTIAKMTQKHNTLVSFVDREEANKVRHWKLNHDRIPITT
jgi:hypothetical protein